MVSDLILIHLFQFQVLVGVKTAIIFGVGNSSSVHINKKKYILVFSEGPVQELDHAMITAEAKSSIKSQ